MLPKVCIASYNRYLSIGQKTLHFLRKVNYPRERILIFVSDSDQANLYRDWVEEDLYGDLIVGVLGLKEQRNFITDYLEEDEIYISMDDDVSDIKFLRLPNTFFSLLIQDAVDKLETRDFGLLGIMPNSDGRRFKEGWTQHLAHIVGAFWIARNHRDLRIEGYSEKEDYERTIKYFKKYGKVLRYRFAGVCTRYVQETGGIPSEGRLERETLAVLDLEARFPLFCKRILKNNWPDIALKWRATNL